MKRLILFSVLSLLQLSAWCNDELSSNFTPGTIGIIYSKNYWLSTGDFITAGNSTATLSGNYVNISSSAVYDWNNTISITSYQTKLEKWSFKLRFKISAWANNSYGIGIGLKSANQYVQNDVLGFIQTTNAGIGGLYILQSNQNILATGTSALGVALNDVIDLEVILFDGLITFNAVNITSGNAKSLNYTFACNGSTPVIPNTSHFAILELGGTHQVQNIEITSTETTGANVVTIGDSKTAGYFANTFAGRYAAQLNNYYAPAVVNAGGADRVTNVLARQPELVALNAAKYLLCIGSNDLRFGGTLLELQANYSALVSILQSTGARVYHILIPEDYAKPLGVNQTAFKNWIASTYGPFYINGVWDSLSTGDILKSIYDSGDGVHLTQAANDKINQAIVTSGKLGGTVLPVKLYSFDVKKVNAENVNIGWRADPFQQAEKYILLKSRDGINFSELAAFPFAPTGVYNYTDLLNSPGNHYYKLQMREANGSVSYSKIATIHHNPTQTKLTGVSVQNSGEIIFELNLLEPANISWKIINQAGSIIHRDRRYMRKGNNLIQAKLKTLPVSIYYLVLYQEKDIKEFVFPFVK